MANQIATAKGRINHNQNHVQQFRREIHKHLGSLLERSLFWASSSDAKISLAAIKLLWEHAYGLPSSDQPTTVVNVNGPGAGAPTILTRTPLLNLIPAMVIHEAEPEPQPEPEPVKGSWCKDEGGEAEG